MSFFKRAAQDEEPSDDRPDQPNDFIDYTKTVSRHKSDAASTHSRKSGRTDRKAQPNGRSRGESDEEEEEAPKKRKSSSRRQSRSEPQMNGTGGGEDDDEDQSPPEKRRSSSKGASRSASRGASKSRKSSRAQDDGDDNDGGSGFEAISHYGNKHEKARQKAAGGASSSSKKQSKDTEDVASPDEADAKPPRPKRSSSRPGKKAAESEQNDSPDESRSSRRKSKSGGAAALDNGDGNASDNSVISTYGNGPEKKRRDSMRSSRRPSMDEASPSEDKEKSRKRGASKSKDESRSRRKSSSGAAAAAAGAGAAAVAAGKGDGNGSDVSDTISTYGNGPEIKRRDSMRSSRRPSFSEQSPDETAAQEKPRKRSASKSSRRKRESAVAMDNGDAAGSDVSETISTYGNGPEKKRRDSMHSNRRPSRSELSPNESSGQEATLAKKGRRTSVRSAKSFPAQRDETGSDAEDPSDEEEQKSLRRRSSTHSNRSRRGREAAEAGAAVGVAAAAGDAARKRRGSSSRRYAREPQNSDDERKSLRSTKSRTSSIFNDRKQGEDEDDASLTAGKGRKIKLTPVERHYLNKALLCIQMQREWSALANIGELAMYGKPFLPHPTGPKSNPHAGEQAQASLFSYLPFIGGGGKATDDKPTSNGTGDWDKPMDPPVLKYLFWRFIKNFPGLNDAKDTYWQERIQPFFDSFAERNFSVTRERSEITKRRLLAMGFTRILGTYFGAAITPLGDAAPSRPDANLMRRVDILFPGSMQSMHRVLVGKKKAQSKDIRYNAWVAIPASSSSGGDKVYTLITRVLAAEDRPVFVTERSLDSFLSFADKLEHLSVDNLLGLPLIPYSEATQEIPHRLSLQRWLRTVVILLSNPKDKLRDHSSLTKARQQLERFLLDRPLKDSERRRTELMETAKKDDEKSEEERTAWQAAGKRARELRTTWAMYRDALIGARELDKSWALVARTPKIVELPPLHRDAVRWCSLWVAYTMHYLYKTSPQAQDLFDLTKGFHKLIPYGLLKTGLRIANPTLAIKTVVNIVLGQPAGQPSLFQRIFHLVMSSQIKGFSKDIATFKSAIGDPKICQILEGYVYAPRGTQEHIRRISYEDDEDIIITILREGDLNESDVADVQDWRDAYDASGVTANDALADDPRRRRMTPEARKYLQIKGLLRALCVKRDREQVMEIVDEPNTPRLIKASISVFYNGLYNIFEACNMANRLGDLQAFLQDLVDTVDRGETDTADFIQLAARHEQSLYYLAHEMFAYGGSMTDPIHEWCRSGLTLLKVGLPDKERGGRQERRLGVNCDRIINEADDQTKAEVLREIRGLIEWSRLRKVQQDIWLRCDLLSTDPKSTMQVNGPEVVREFSEQEREAVDYIDNAQGSSNAGGVAWAWFADADVLEHGAAIHKAARDAAGIQGKKKKGKKSVDHGVPSAGLEAGTNLPPPPRLTATKTLVDAWVDGVSRSLTSAKDNKVK